VIGKVQDMEINNVLYNALMATLTGKTGFDQRMYVVHKEHTLGVISPELPGEVMVIEGLVLKGGADWMNGPVPVSEGDSIRPAMVADFKAFRVSPPTGFADIDLTTGVDWNAVSRAGAHRPPGGHVGRQYLHAGR